MIVVVMTCAVLLHVFYVLLSHISRAFLSYLYFYIVNTSY